MRGKLINILIVVFVMMVAACSGLQPSPTPTGEAVSPTQPATQPADTPTPTGAWMSLSPAEGGPGTLVRIEGYLPDGPSAAEAVGNDTLNHADVCWGGCLEGFREINVEVAWLEDQAGHFTSEFMVPPIPWMTNGGPQALVPGLYDVSMQCLGRKVEGCALLSGELNASFTLVGQQPDRCQSGQSCDTMRFEPDRAAPGELVTVSGWAPLDALYSYQPWGYNLVIQDSLSGDWIPLAQLSQTLEGDISGNFQVPASLPGSPPLQPGSYTLYLGSSHMVGEGKLTQVLLGGTTFEILAGTTWASLDVGSPLLVQVGEEMFNPALAQDPVNENRLAYCVPGGIQVSDDGGQRWAFVPSATAAEALVGTDYLLGVGVPPEASSCVNVTLDSTHPDSYFAVFTAQSATWGAPPVFHIGLVTADAGLSWKRVPTPSGDLEPSFGGFWTDGGGLVQAMFSGQSVDPFVVPPVSVQESRDGGKTWTPGELVCPSGGPCVRWGPVPGIVSGMGTPLPQWVYASFDGGQAWQGSLSPIELRIGGPHQLATLEDGTLLLISGSENYPLRFSLDGGATWKVATLPTLPSTEFISTFPGLQLLPSGGLLSMTSSSGYWALLSPKAGDWCLLERTDMPAMAVSMRFSGEQILWFDPVSQEVGSVSQAELICP